MTAIIFNPNQNINEVYEDCLSSGSIYIYDYSKQFNELIDYSKGLIFKYFERKDNIQNLQDELELNDFISKASALKTQFTDSKKTHQLMQDLMKNINLYGDNIYFDKPRMRIVTYNKYLETGVGYAYKPHRDSWYAGPIAQLNFWLPIFDVDKNSTLAFFPKYWNKAIKNKSKNFDYDFWKSNFRDIAKDQVGQEKREHPLPEEEIDYNDEIRLTVKSGNVIVFPGTHLHATVPNIKKNKI